MRPRIRQQRDGNLDGKYWAGTVAANIFEYNQMQASLSTPQYGLNKGLKVFGKAAYDAVVKNYPRTCWIEKQWKWYSTLHTKFTKCL